MTFFETVMGEPWFAGGYIWEFDLNENDGPDPVQHYNFSPRHKSAEKVIRDFYSRIYN